MVHGWAESDTVYFSQIRGTLLIVVGSYTRDTHMYFDADTVVVVVIVVVIVICDCRRTRGARPIPPAVEDADGRLRCSILPMR